MRTWEQTIKFDSELSVGTHCVNIENNKGEQRTALVEITNRGKVYLLAKPSNADMYTSWSLIEGDSQKDAGRSRNKIYLWGAHDPELMARFENPIKTIRKQSQND